MLQQKIEEAFVKKYISKIKLAEKEDPVYGIFTGRINVISSVSENNDTSYSYRYYFKQVDMVKYSTDKDLYKAMQDVFVIMQDQIADIDHAHTTGFSGKSLE
jgi:hypothetical protein